MPGLRCPRCHATLGTHTRTGTPFERCATCRGVAVHLSTLRKFGPGGRVRSLWKQLEEGLPGGTCPSCDKPMVAASVRGGPCPLAVETCRACRVVWFNGDDLAAFAAQRNSLWHRVPGLAPPDASAGAGQPSDETQVVIGLLDVVALAP
jgi:Zn-finger nucleic acid-binding protein